MSKTCGEEQLIERYETMRKRIKTRIVEIAKSYDQLQPLNQYFALLYNDPELEQLDQELCEMEKQLPDSYQFDRSS